ncbi:unnamed protein product [Ixodes hexagonus]
MAVQAQPSDVPVSMVCPVEDATEECVPNLEKESAEEQAETSPAEGDSSAVDDPNASGDPEPQDDSRLPNGEVEAVSPEDTTTYPAVRDPSVEKLMASFGDTAQHMKQEIMEALQSRLDTVNTVAESNPAEEDAIKRLAVLKLAIQKSANEASSSSKPAGSSNARVAEATRKSPSPLQERLSAERSPPPAAVAAAKTVPKAATPEKQPEQNTNVPEQPASPCCGMRRSLNRKAATQEANSTAGAKRKGDRAVAECARKFYISAEIVFFGLLDYSDNFGFPYESEKSVGDCSEHGKKQCTREQGQGREEHRRHESVDSQRPSVSCRNLKRHLSATSGERKRLQLVGAAILLVARPRGRRGSAGNSVDVASRRCCVDIHVDATCCNVNKVLQQKELQVQVATTHLQRAQGQLQQERQQFLREKQTVLQQVADSQRQACELAAREAHLRQELCLYTSKYEEFQGALSQSNQVFRTFKADMDKMSKKIKKLEKETVQWKTRWESSNTALLDLGTEKQKRDKELVAAQQRVITLEKLCRALQLERNELSQKVKGGEAATAGAPEVVEQQAESCEVAH